MKKIIKYFFIATLAFTVLAIIWPGNGPSPSKETSPLKAEEIFSQHEIDSINNLIQEYENMLPGAYAKLRKESDEFNPDPVWYYGKRTSKYRNRNDIYMYLAKFKSGLVKPRLVIQYHADDWLFIKGYEILTDNNKYEIKLSRSADRDNNGGKIWEWADLEWADRYAEILNDIADSQTAKIRHNGQKYYKDRTITSREKQAIKDVMAVYELERQLKSSRDKLKN